MRRRRNPEEDLRNLEQLAEQGDTQAREKLVTSLGRIQPKEAFKAYQKFYNGATILVPFSFTEDDLRSILVTAFEGGIGSWAIIIDYAYPPGLTAQDFNRGSSFNPVGGDSGFPRYVTLPLVPGGAVIIADNEDFDPRTQTAAKSYRLDREALIRGLEILAKTNIEIFSRIKTAEFDASVADCIIQCAIFGAIVYG